jgi:hypothetical protein
MLLPRTLSWEFMKSSMELVGGKNVIVIIVYRKCKSGHPTHHTYNTYTNLYSQRRYISTALQQSTPVPDTATVRARPRKTERERERETKRD